MQSINTQREAVLSAPVDEVCLMEDRARVTRKGSVSLEAGRQRLVLATISPILVDKTLVVAVLESGANVSVIDARVVRAVVVHAKSDDVSTQLERLNIERQERCTKIADLNAKHERTAQHIRGMTETLHLGLREVVEDTRWNRSGGAAEFAELANLREKTMEWIDRCGPIASLVEEEEREIAILDAQICELQSPSAHRTARLEIDVDAVSACNVRLEVAYAVPGACWRPAHRADRVSSEDGDRVNFETDACVWQNTGEDWDDVQLVFSTERASLGVAPPTLEGDVLRVQRKSVEIAIEAREQAAAELGPQGAGGQRTSPELPGIDDGGATMNLRAPARASLASDGRPYRVFLSAFESAAESLLVAMPEVSPCVLQSCTFDNCGSGPILAGPVDLLQDGGVVGASKVLFIAPGERFELGWGPETELRIHREVSESSETSRVLSSWRVKQHDIKVRLSNIGQGAHRIRVTERVPVSEIDKVKIEVDVDDTTSRQSADENGFVTWSLEVGPGGNETLALRYRVKKHEDVQG